MKRIVAFFLMISMGLVLAQQPYKKEELRKKSKALSSEISKLNKTLNETRSDSKKSLLYIKNLEKKINAQQELVRVSIKERKVLEDEIYLSQLEINKLRRELSELKKEYKDVLINAYKNKSLQNKVLFILSSKSFTEAFRRVKYLERYSDFQGEKAEEIDEKQKAIRKTIASREKAIEDKQKVLANQVVLKENLEQEKQEQSKVLAVYRKDEGEIRRKIASKQAENKKLEAEIQRIIEEEIRIAREKAEAERKAREEAERKERERLAKLEAERKAKEAERKAKAERERQAAIAAGKPEPEPITEPEPEPITEPEPEPVYETRTASEKLASSFTASKGILPWPVTQGTVVGKFGRQPHPVLRDIITKNPGVLIATQKNSNAKAVYSGTVQKVFLLQGGNKAVMLSHGTYYTIYNNLSTVFVNKGDKVSTLQDLGTIYTDSDANTILDFQIWKGGNKENPANWVRGM